MLFKTPFNWPAKFEPVYVPMDLDPQKVTLYPIYKDVIDLLDRHYLMTSRQVRYRLFSPGSRTCTKSLLKLARAGYIKVYNLKPYNRKHPYRVFGVGPRSVKELKYALPPLFDPLLAVKILVTNQLYLRLWELPGRPSFYIDVEGATTGYFLFRMARFAFTVLRDHEGNRDEVRGIIARWPLHEKNLIVIAENEGHVARLAPLFKDWIIPVRYTTDGALYDRPLSRAFIHVTDGRLQYTRARVFET